MKLFGRNRTVDAPRSLTGGYVKGTDSFPPPPPGMELPVPPSAMVRAPVESIAHSRDGRRNAIARAIQSSRVEFIPLSVRYAAAMQADEFVQAWLDEDW